MNSMRLYIGRIPQQLRTVVRTRQAMAVEVALNVCQAMAVVVALNVMLHPRLLVKLIMTMQVVMWTAAVKN